MIVKILFNPILAFALFVSGIGLATVNISFGLLSILGGLLFGLSSQRNEVGTMNKKTKGLFYGTFIFLLSLFSISFLIIARNFL
ncbi:hypothetical protein ACXYMX_09015 [Sporosarcina sp. CAU 1771]